MGNCSTLCYIVDNTNLSEKTDDIYSFEDLIEDADQFLSSFFNEIEFEVDENIVNRVLETCR
jgi:hypothetical protein